MVKRKKYTKVAQGLAQGLDQSEAVRGAGYAESTVRKKAYQIVQRPLVQSALTDALERQGLTMEKLMKVYLEALEANHVVKSSERLEAVETEVPDVRMRVDAANHVAQFYGGVPQSVEMPGPAPPGLHVTIECATPPEQRAPKDITPPATSTPIQVVIEQQEAPSDNGRRRPSL